MVATIRKSVGCIQLHPLLICAGANKDLPDRRIIVCEGFMSKLHKNSQNSLNERKLNQQNCR